MFNILYSNENDFHNLFKFLLKKIGIKHNPYSLIEYLNQYFSNGNNDIYSSFISLFKFYGIECYVEINLDLILALNQNSVVTFYSTSTKGVAFLVYLGKTENGVYEFYDPYNNISTKLSYTGLLSKWAGVGIIFNLDRVLMPEQLSDTRYPKFSDNQGVSVIMPIYNQANFVVRAINSLLSQDYTSWELIIIDDCSSDSLFDVIAHFLSDTRIHYTKNKKNLGLGATLNIGLKQSNFDYVAYLPGDDFYSSTHITNLINTINYTNSDLVYSGVFHHSNARVSGSYGVRSVTQVPGFPLQLVQVLHRKIDKYWVERSELTTDDLYLMYWNRFDRSIGTYNVSATWVDHFYQRHKIINDRKGGGIYLYKKYYNVSEPLKFQSTVGNYIDEVEHYREFRSPLPKFENENENPLKILLVGELAFNPERIVELEKKGHILYGLWIDRPANFNTVGPLPFGNVIDIPIDNWFIHVKEIQPDIIYALLNYHAVPLAHHVLINNLGIPFVWHFKEGPSYCKDFGTWDMLLDLYTKSDGQIYNNELTREWFSDFFPYNKDTSFILDGDLPSLHWFGNNRTPLISNGDSSIHTVVAGRPIGLNSENILSLANQNIHVHIYGEIFHSQFETMIKDSQKLAPDHLHLHKNCPQENWVSEFSKYDAGWLHFFNSNNFGDVRSATWDDLNFPARMATYAMAGLPMLMKDNNGHRVASQEFLSDINMAILYKDFDDVGSMIRDKSVDDIRNNVWNKRELFAFNTYVDDLVAFFRKIIRLKNYEK